jgi:hypothetical protein
MAAQAILGAAFLFLVGIPFGLLLLRVLEWLRGRPLAFTVPERALVAPFLATGFLLIVASIPIPVFGASLLAGAWGLGFAGMGFLWFRERGRGLRDAVRWCARLPGAAVVLGTAGLVVLELLAAGTRSFPNAYDGSFQSLYVHLLITNHTLAGTLEPYASMGVVYPQGAAVWMALPPLVFGWPVQSAAVVLPPFFLGLTPLAAFCWGDRLGGPGTDRGTRWGLSFAAFFGLVASWPRLFIGGSYDFVFCFPLFLLALGWLRPFVESGLRSWGDVIAFGGLVGLATSLSLSIGETLILLLVAFMVVFWRPGLFPGLRTVPRFLVILAIGAAFVTRSLVGVGLWYRYPAHVLSPVGNPPTVTIPGLPSPSFESYVGNLYPFIPYKWKLSPLPWISLEVAVLLALGLILAIVWLTARPGSLRRLLPLELTTPVLLSTAVMFLWTLLLVAASGPSFLASIFDPLASLYESSFLLFFFFEAVALLPLLLALEILVYQRQVGQVSSSEARSGASGPGDSKGIGGPPPRRKLRPWAVVGLSLLLVVPFAIGAGTTVTQVPGFLSDHLAEFSNVTAADVDALEWAGSHLPPCSVVLVAPGSAAGFLPLYATVHVDFPMMPLSVNGSYNLAVSNLTNGIYTPATQNALTYLGVTEVFVTGQTSVTYAAFDPAPLGASPSFELLFHEQDAFLFEFRSTVNSTGCAPD